jgi:hypothetical protein
MASNGMAFAFLVVISARGPSLGAVQEGITQFALHRADFSQTAALLPPTASRPSIGLFCFGLACVGYGW